jgi:hypothetical protein
MNWVRAIKKDYEREIFAIDGKTVRGHFKAGAGGKAPHIVSAWVTENRLVFGQVKTEEKSNEITAIPTLLEKLALTVARADTETKSSIIGRRKQMAWSNEYLEWLLFQSPFTSGSG